MSDLRVASTGAATPVELRDEATFLPSRTQFFILLACYFGIQAITRALISETFGLDDAYQVMLAQKLAWGYGPQPPLYTWLVIGVTRLLGTSTFSLVLLKEALLFTTYLLTYLNARWLTRRHVCGVVAAVALQFIPSVSWESQRDLTNTVLASTLVMSTLFIFYRLDPKRWPAYVWLGICAGLGVLSKYNYVIFYLALLAGGLSLPGLRQRVWNRRMLLALLISLVIVLPNLV
ncbi:MAG TPA: glycosyltransferase family 39 protein, partial [Verrucomicrobiae bacterium]|nr:glycosyltransferase family 39 protein [Verrucomicrobiae bacterium]